MKNLTEVLLLLFVFFALSENSFGINSEAKDEILYKIMIAKNNPKIAKVKVSFVPKDEILYMTPGGNELPKRWATFVQNLKARDDKGNEISVEELGDAKWKMTLTNNQKVFLNYEIRLDHENYKWSGGIDGVAFSRDWGVFYAGRTLFILNGENWKKINVEFEVSENWKVTTPWKMLKNKENSFLVNNSTQLVNSLIFAGTHEEISIKRKDFELLFALGGAEVVMQKEEFKKLAEGVLDYYIDLMGGLPKPAPNNKFKKAVVIVNSSNTTDGEVIGNNISILVGRGDDKNAKIFSRFIFAHEFFHLWNGKSFHPENNESEWFKEGFTNYYTLKSLRNIGFLTDETYLEIINSLFYQRYRNDEGVGRIPLIKGEEKHDHWGLIYGGGMFVGIAQDLMIRQATNNQKSLDDLMKYMFNKYGGTDKSYKLIELRQKMSELNGTDQTDFFKNYIWGIEKLPMVEFFKIAGLKAEIEKDNLILSKNENATDLQKHIQEGFFACKVKK